MSWSSIIGQERVKSLLRRILQSGEIAHAFLFYGPEGIGKDALAIEFAKALNCQSGDDQACGTCNNCKRAESFQHPNIKLVFALPVGKNEKTGDDPLNVLPESQIEEVREHITKKAKDPYHRIEVAKANFIKINSVREIKREAAMSKTETGRKIFIILNADMMNIEASNSLLKTLEEPLPDTILLLTTSAKDQLLPTIISRCQLIKCDLLTEVEIEQALINRDCVDSSTAHLAAQIANGNYSYARRLSSINMKEERDGVVDFLRLILSKNKISLIDSIEEYSTLGKVEIERWLRLMQSWLRDALLLQQTVQIPNIDDEKQSMKNFLEKFPNANLVASIQSVEKSIAQIDKNIYLNLILTNLAIDLRKHITDKK